MSQRQWPFFVSCDAYNKINFFFHNPHYSNFYSTTKKVFTLEFIYLSIKTHEQAEI